MVPNSDFIDYKSKGNDSRNAFIINFFKTQEVFYEKGFFDPGSSFVGNVALCSKRKRGGDWLATIHR